jgi:hypothetical protein
MEPKNNLHLTTSNNINTTPFLANSTVNSGIFLIFNIKNFFSESDVFSTLCNLATTTNSGFNTQSQLLFPHISNEWNNNNSNNWLDHVN